MNQRRNIKEQNKGGNIWRKLFICLISFCLLLQCCFCIIVFIHNHSAQLYEYIKPDWFLLVQLLVCLLGLVLIIHSNKWDSFAKLIKKFLIVCPLLIILFVIKWLINSSNLDFSYFNGEVICIEFLDDNEGYVFVNSQESPISIFKTENGGLSWESVYKMEDSLSIVIDPATYVVNDIIHGRILINNEIGMTEYERDFSFSTSCSLFTFESDSVLLRSQFVEQNPNINAVFDVLNLMGFNQYDGVDTLDNRIAIFATKAFKKAVLFSADNGDSWQSFPLSSYNYGPISLTENYLYTNRLNRINKYTIKQGKLCHIRL